MSEGFLPPLIARLIADTSEFKAKMGAAAVQAEEVSARSNSSLSKMATVGKAAFLGLAAAAVGFGAETLHLADQFEQAHARLETAIHNVGGEFNKLGPQVSAVDSKMAKFGFTATDTESALAKLVAATKNPTKSIQEMGLAADIARGRNISLASATDLLVKVQTGHVALLGRLGIAVKDSTGKMITQQQALQRLSEMYGGAAQRNAGTFAGKLEALKAEVENLGIKIGMALIPVIEGAIQVLLEVGQVVASVVGWFEHHQAAAAALAAVLAGALIPALVRTAVVLGREVFEAAALAIEEMTSAAAGAVNALKSMSAAEESLSAVGGPVMLGLTMLTAGLVFAFMSARAEVTKIKQAVDAYADSLNATTYSAQSQIDKEHQLQAALTARIDIIKKLHADDQYNGRLALSGEALAAHQRAVTQGFVDSDAAVQEYRKQLGMTAEQVRTMLTNESALASQFGLSTSQVEDLAAANNIDLSKSLDAVQSRMAAVVVAVNLSHHPIQQAAADIKSAGDKSKDASAQVIALKNSLDLLAGKALSADEAAITFRNNIAQLDKALKASHGSMSLNTQAGRDARQQFDSTAQSAIDLATSIKDSTNSTEKARASLHGAIQLLKEHAGTSDTAKSALERLRGAYDRLGPAATAGSHKAVVAIAAQAAAARAAAEEVGAAAGGGLAAGLQSKMGAVTVQAKLLADQLAKVTRLSLQINSPSRVFHAIGQGVVEGLINGLKSMETQLQTRMDRVTQRITAVRSAAAALRSSVTSAIVGDASLSNITGSGANGAVQLGDIIGSLGQQQSRDLSFLRELGTLRKRGLSSAYIAQIASMGATQGGQYADALMSATNAQLQQVSGLGASISGIANRTGAFAASDVYGKHLTVLTQQQTELRHDLRELIHDLRQAQRHDKDRPLVVELYLDGKHIYNSTVTHAQRSKQRNATTSLG